jgi:hypothetical protein
MGTVRNLRKIMIGKYDGRREAWMKWRYEHDTMITTTFACDADDDADISVERLLC